VLEYDVTFFIGESHAKLGIPGDHKWTCTPSRGEEKLKKRNWNFKKCIKSCKKGSRVYKIS
jgi:hypothetical protein